MKKTITLILAMFMVVSGNAQLRVDTIGRIRLGNDVPSSNSTFVNRFNTTITNSTRDGALLLNNYNNPGALWGLNVNLSSSTNYPIAIYAFNQAKYDNTIVYGTKSITFGTYTTAGSQYLIGLFGGAEYDASTTSSAGVYGSSTSSFYLPNVADYYAGYFSGDIRTTGTIYGTLVSPSSVASPSQGGTTINLSEQITRGETITEKLKQVDLLQMERINQDGSLAANKAIKKAICVNDEGEEVPTENPVQTKLSSISYGLAADQLKEVYPELVYEDKEGNYSINYIEMVPLLVQSIKELSAEVATLKEQLGVQDPKKSVMKARSKQAEDADEVQLTIPDEAQKIHLNIYDLSGKTVRTTDVNESGNVRLSTYTKGLPTGTYAYSLIVDGKKQKTRKMIVKE